MSTKPPAVIMFDFETHGSEQRPNYPPKPVSLAIKWPDQREYKLMAWGHEAGGNNCTEGEARRELEKAYKSRHALLAHYFEFDADVAETHWGLTVPAWDRFHDTLFLVFLNNPHTTSLALKEAAYELLGTPPDEQDRLKEWILANVPEARRAPSTAGKYIWKAPYSVVRPYHKGDLTRNIGLFNYLWPRVIDAGMGPAYDRERRLMPILLRNARRGMRVDVPALERDIPLMRKGLTLVDTWLRKRLGPINLNSPKQLGDALYDKGIVTVFKETRHGQRSTSKKHLTIDRFADKQVYQALTYRAQMDTSVGTFMEPWLGLAGTGDVIHPSWSQVRSAKGDTRDTKGARSGRIICSKPNLLNIPKKWKKSAVAGYVHPAFIKGLPPLPFMRTYALPHKGKQWGRRDYNQQEVRIFAHYEEGPVFQGFMQDPRFDMHEGVRAAEEAALIAAGLRDEFDRDSAKGTVFGAFYGQGLKGLMELLKLAEGDEAVGKIIHTALHQAAPSIRLLSKQLEAMAKDKSPEYPNGRPIKTWGDRLYFCEPPMYVAKFNRDMTFEYKLISYLIQGSGADVIKEALIRYDVHPKRTEDLTVTVYDEINIDLPLSSRGAKHEMTVLRDCMQSIEMDVPMLSDGEVGPNWGTLKKYEV